MGILYLPVPIFLLRFLILPTVFNFSAVGIANYILKAKRFSEETKDFAVCLCCFMMCACVQNVHAVFAPVLCAPIVAVYISGIFGNVRITRWITLLSISSLIVAAIASSMELRKGDLQLPLDTFVAFVILMCSYSIGILLIRREKERTESLYESYRKQTELSEQLNRDVLTGLYNRKAMHEMLHYEMKNSNSLYFAVLDIDDFKIINDTYGHSKGDEVLLYLSKIFREHVGQIGYAIRFGGEEFAIIFPDVEEAEVIKALEEVRKRLAEHKFYLSEDSIPVQVTISCGVIPYTCGQTVEDFFLKADKAMYQAKRMGKNTVCMANKAVSDSSATR